MPRYTPADEVFPTDRWVDTKSMIGRQTEAAGLATELDNGLNRLMAGPRRMGKTTLCRAALSTVRTGGRYVVGVDLFYVNGLDGLAKAIIDEVVANRSGLAKARHAAAKGGRKIVSAATVTPVARLRADLGEDITIALEPALRRRDPIEALRKSIQAAQRVCEIDDKRLVLFVDEFQELAGPKQPFGDPDRVTKVLRAALQDADRITTLFAGSVEHMMRDLFGPTHRAFYLWGGWHQLEPIDARTWQEGLTGRYHTNQILAPAGTVERVVDLGEGHSRSTMLIAKQAYLTAIAEGEHTLSMPTVEHAVDQALAADAPYHDTTVKDLRETGKDLLDVAERIARGEPPYKDRGRASAAQRAIRALETKGLITKTAPTGRGGWRLVDPLLRRYLAQRG